VCEAETVLDPALPAVGVVREFQEPPCEGRATPVPILSKCFFPSTLCTSLPPKQHPLKYRGALRSDPAGRLTQYASFRSGVSATAAERVVTHSAEPRVGPQAPVSPRGPPAPSSTDWGLDVAYKCGHCYGRAPSSFHTHAINP